MSRRRVLTVDLDSFRTTISGPGAWSLIHEITGRKPFYVSRTKSFSTSEETARDIVALAETRYYDVVVTGPRAVRAARRVDPELELEPEPEPEQGGLF